MCKADHCLSRECGTYTFNNFLLTLWDSKNMGAGTCLEAQKSTEYKVVSNSWKLYFDTEEWSSLNHITSQLWSDATFPRTGVVRPLIVFTFWHFVTLYSSKRTRQQVQQRAMVRGHVASDYGSFVGLSRPGESGGNEPEWYGRISCIRFWFLVCYAATLLALQLHQKRIQLVCSTKVVHRILTESKGTPAMDLGLEGIRIHI